MRNARSVLDFLELLRLNPPQCFRLHVELNFIQEFANHCSTNKCTVLLLCISLLISCYMFWFNCYHQGANTYIAESYSNKIRVPVKRIFTCSKYRGNFPADHPFHPFRSYLYACNSSSLHIRGPFRN